MDVEAAREIHRGKFMKSDFYTTGSRVQSMFSTRDPEFHARRRRQLGPYFADSSLNSFEPTVVDLVQLVMLKMGEEAKRDGYIDVLKWWTLFSLDVIGELTFAESLGMVRGGEKTQYVEDIALAGTILPYRTAFPLLIWLGNFLPLGYFKYIATSRNRVIGFHQERVKRFRRRLETLDYSGIDTNGGINNVNHTLFGAVVKAGASEWTDFEISGEVHSIIGAGTDTTAVTMSYLVWAVCRNQQVKERLVNEVRCVAEPLTHKAIRDLPYLNCVIEEALRCYSATPGPLPRFVPSGGTTLAGHYLRPGVVVTTSAYSIHRDPETFPNPEKFDPSRWENPTKRMKDAFCVFGTGPRSCVGLHLARMELRLATTAFFRTYPNAHISSLYGMSDDDMSQDTRFLMMPRGHRCLVELE